MRRLLLAELLLNGRKKFVEFPRLYYRPRNDLQFPRMESCDEVCILFVLHNLLEFESEPMCMK